MKSTWKFKNKGAKFESAYERESGGERVFVLTRKKPYPPTKRKLKKRRRITFESWQMAKSMGWVKQ